MQVSIRPNGVFGGWVSAQPPNATIAPSATGAFVLAYDISQNEFQGVNTADVLITTSARPSAKVWPHKSPTTMDIK